MEASEKFVGAGQRVFRVQKITMRSDMGGGSKK